MPLLETPQPTQPTAEDGARMIRRILSQSVNQMDRSLAQVRHIVQRYGRSEIETALGADAAELQAVYQKLKQCLQEVDNSRDVPDLPSS